MVAPSQPEMKVPVTTLMLSRLPSKYTQEMFLNEISDVMGPDANFDFLYLPWDARRGHNSGYAFINFPSNSKAEECLKLFEGHTFSKSAKRQVCKVFTAHIQGLESNLIHMMGTPLGSSGACQPVIVWQGHVLEFDRVVAVLRQLPAQPHQAPTSRSPKLPGGGPWPDGESALEGPPGLCEGRLSPGARSKLMQLSLSGENDMASTRVPSSGWVHGGASDAGDAGGDDLFNRAFAEMSLARRLSAVMEEKSFLLPEGTLTGSNVHTLTVADLFGDGREGCQSSRSPPPTTLSLGHGADTSPLHRARSASGGACAGSGGAAEEPPEPEDRPLAACDTADELLALQVQKELEAALWSPATCGTAEELPELEPWSPAACRAAAGRLPPGLALLEEPSVIELPMDLTSRALGRFFARHAAFAVRAAAPPSAVGWGPGCYSV